MSDSKYRLTVVVSSYISSLFAIVLSLIVTHVGLYVYYYQVDELPWLLVQLFDLNEENNLPTWFSSFLLLNNAFFIFLYSEQDPSRRKYWRFMAAGFFVLSIDETAGMHETFNTSVEMNWAIPGAILVLIVGSAFVPFLLSIRRGLAGGSIMSGVLYVSGAIIVE